MSVERRENLSMREGARRVAGVITALLLALVIAAALIALL
jgi:hypothetical protein